ncbi:MAG TPA: phosphatase PAP2 family protein [Terriglobales bacterium]|nr:phosphatase PAP2 family protein [Terriglobales bacterium]
MPIFLCCCFSQHSWAQDSCLAMGVPRQIVRDFGHYATAIAKSPAKLGHLNGRDVAYLIAFSGATAALLATDTHISNSIDSDHEDRRESNYASNLMIGAALSTSTIKYFVGCHEHNRQRRDDAVREWESMGFALGAVGGLKYIFRRQRPGPGSNGDFFDSSTSFPSGHAAVSTAWAATLGEEYASNLPEYFALGGAGAVSALRITAKKHFPSDALVGGIIGYLTGSYICRHGKCEETPSKAGIGHGDSGRLEAESPASDVFEQDRSVYAARRQFCNSISATKEEAERCGQLTPIAASDLLSSRRVVERDPPRKAPF